MPKLQRMKKRYFGYYPIVNILVSKLVFATLRYRAFRLKFYWKYKAFRLQLSQKLRNQATTHVQLINNQNTVKKFEEFLQQGFDKLNIGGGNKNFSQFINLDFVSHSHIEREVVANILDLNFIPDSCISHVHSNHLIEHITQEQLEKHFLDCKRILKPGGIISMRCPNALGVSYGFFFEVTPEKDHQAFLDLGYPQEEDFCNPLDGWYHKDLYGFYHWIYAFTGNRENEHLNILTPTKLKTTVEKAGFQILRMTEPETSNLVIIAKCIK